MGFAIKGAARASERRERHAEVEPLREARAANATATLTLAKLRSFERDRSCRISRWGEEREIVARLAEGLDLAVAETALRHGEPLVIVEDADGPTVVGALRTSATPGVDRAEEMSIEATRLRIVADEVGVTGRVVGVEGSEELRLRSRAAFVVLRAVGEIESFAERIVTRAEGVHKLVGRMLRLN